MASLPEDAEVRRLHANGRPHVVELKRPATLDGVLCAARGVCFHDDGALEQATVGGVCEIQGWKLEENDTISLRPDRTIEQLFFDRPRAVLGRDGVHSVLFDGGAPIELAAGNETFGVSGVLIRRHLGERTENIDGVGCTSVAEFHPNGRLRMAALASPLVTAFGELPIRSFVSFDESGELRRATLGASCILGEKSFDRGSSVLFTKEGVVENKGGWRFYTPYSG